MILVKDTHPSPRVVYVQTWEKGLLDDILIDEVIIHGPSDVRDFKISKEQYLKVLEV